MPFTISGVNSIDVTFDFLIVSNIKSFFTILPIHLRGKPTQFSWQVIITTDAIPTDANVTIGRQSDNKFYFDGIIDEVAIFNVALEEEDIQTFMNEGIPKAVVRSGKLVSTWAALRK